MISWRIIYYLMLIQRQLIQHRLPLFATTNPRHANVNSAALLCSSSRSYCAEIYFISRAVVVIPFFAYFGNGRASARRFFVSSLNFLVGDTASKICVTVMSCAMTVDKHLTLTESNLITRFSMVPVKHYFHSSVEIRQF